MLLIKNQSNEKGASSFFHASCFLRWTLELATWWQFPKCCLVNFIHTYVYTVFLTWYRWALMTPSAQADGLSGLDLKCPGEQADKLTMPLRVSWRYLTIGLDFQNALNTPCIIREEAFFFRNYTNSWPKPGPQWLLMKRYIDWGFSSPALQKEQYAKPAARCVH